MTTNLGLVRHTDGLGTVHLGWIGTGVIYARLEKALSADLGGVHTRQLAALVAGSTSVQYFADARALTEYDLLARSSFARVVLAHRRKFAKLTFLTWSEGIGPAARAMAETLGGSVDILVDAKDFEVRLCAAAPLAAQVLASAARDNSGRDVLLRQGG